MNQLKKFGNWNLTIFNFELTRVLKFDFTENLQFWNLETSTPKWHRRTSLKATKITPTTTDGPKYNLMHWKFQQTRTTQQAPEICPKIVCHLQLGYEVQQTINIIITDTNLFKGCPLCGGIAFLCLNEIWIALLDFWAKMACFYDSDKLKISN